MAFRTIVVLSESIRVCQDHSNTHVKHDVHVPETENVGLGVFLFLLGFLHATLRFFWPFEEAVLLARVATWLESIIISTKRLFNEF